ncbi:ribonuclease E/G [Cupriavidus basilensis]
MPRPWRIEKTLYEGQALMVQVIKDPIGTKGARLSTQVSIAGRTLVYLPQDPHIGISQRIEGEVDREALRSRVQTPGTGGRTRRLYRAHHCRRVQPMRNLATILPTCARSGPPSARMPLTLPAPSLLYQDLNLAQRVLRDFVNDATNVIQVDSRENYQKLVEFAEEYTPAVLPRAVALHRRAPCLRPLQYRRRNRKVPCRAGST